MQEINAAVRLAVQWRSFPPPAVLIPPRLKGAIITKTTTPSVSIHRLGEGLVQTEQIGSNDAADDDNGRAEQTTGR